MTNNFKFETEARMLQSFTVAFVLVFASDCQEDNNPSVEQIPAITTSAASEITESTATSGGDVTGDGGAAVTERGICWSINENPTTGDSRTSSGSGTGMFVSELTSLAATTVYHVRSYATNAIGTAYGNDVSFTTSVAANSTVANVTTALVSGITKKGAVGGGNVTRDGGSSVSARGVCWSTNHDPTVDNSKTSDGVGVGGFSSVLTALAASTTYYVRAYATNAMGTAYGNEVSFMTSAESSGNTVMDADGNTYNVVTIGAQIWMTENLKSTKYDDGTNIALVMDSLGWMNDKAGAYTWYHNDIANKGLYGALYNWYAVNTGKLCPADWHVPSDDEWTTLEDYLITNGYNYDGTTNGDHSTNNKLAISMADIATWSHSDDAASPGNTDFSNKRNTAGFKALAAGYKDFYGSFGFFTSDGQWHRHEGITGAWWTSTETGTGSVGAWWRSIGTYQTAVFRSNNNKYYGLSVRCAKD